MLTVGRNEQCPCGSGKRYKDCCGRLRSSAAPAQPDVASLMNAALVAQQARRLDDAESLYRRALAAEPDLPDALHMLGVIRYDKGDDAQAWTLIVRALDLTDWRYPSYRHNLGLVLARAWRSIDEPTVTIARRRYRELSASRSSRAPHGNPRVAVVVPSFNHARFIEQALKSVFEQTYRNIELVVVDDGSTDASVATIERALRRSPFPHRFIVRGNRGAPATINEGIATTDAPFINVLNSDDAFDRERIATMIDAVAGTRAQWGFSRATFIDDDGAAVDLLHNRRAYTLTCLVDGMPLEETVGFAVVKNNVALTSGNLFFARALFDAVGGFRDFRYTHDWDFALQALAHAEPVFVADSTYRYRLHASNTITESSEAPRLDAYRMTADFLRRALSPAAPASPVAPCLANWGQRFAVAVFSTGMADVIDPATLRALAASRPPPQSESLQ